jgi:hypothetical protein
MNNESEDDTHAEYVHSTLEYIHRLVTKCQQLVRRLPLLMKHQPEGRNGVTVDRKVAQFIREDVDAFDCTMRDPLKQAVTVVCLRHLFSLLIYNVQEVVMEDSAPLLLPRLRSMHMDSLYWTEVPLEYEVDDIHTRTRYLLSFEKSHRVTRCINEMQSLLINQSDST